MDESIKNILNTFECTQSNAENGSLVTLPDEWLAPEDNSPSPESRVYNKQALYPFSGAAECNIHTCMYIYTYLCDSVGVHNIGM